MYTHTHNNVIVHNIFHKQKNILLIKYSKIPKYQQFNTRRSNNNNNVFQCQMPIKKNNIAFYTYKCQIM